MSFQLSGIDRELIKNVEIEIVTEPPAASGFPLGNPLPIQFPPRITDDTKSANWQEEEITTFEPLAIWRGSLPRKVGIELTYIVTGGQFTTSFIAQITKQVKAYFYRSMADKNPFPLVKLRFYDHFGKSGRPMDSRLFDVNITHGETLIKDNAGIFPLLTKIKMNLTSVTKIGGKVQIPGLLDKPPIDWY